MGRTILFATGNQDKLQEFREIWGDTGDVLHSLKDEGIRLVAEENGATFEENALIKAREAAASSTADLVLADDSGLEIDYLHGEPGIYSARYLGEDTSYRIKNAALIKRLQGVPKEQRTARFVCTIAAVWREDGRMKECIVRGTIEGYIGWEESGIHGFGYDPIFYVDEYGCSTAEMDPALKNRISHRANAIRLLKEKLAGQLDGQSDGQTDISDSLAGGATEWNR